MTAWVEDEAKLYLGGGFDWMDKCGVSESILGKERGINPTVDFVASSTLFL
jgi:hypothetical protein